MMKRTASFGTKTRLALAITMLAVLSACGGGGGDGPPAPALIDLTVANRDTVAHASATGLLAMDVPWALVLHPLLAKFGGVSGLRDRPMAVITDPPYACDYGGQFMLSMDDLNNNGAWDPGEVISVTYSDCNMTGSDILRGEAQMTLLGNTSTSLNVKVSMPQQLSDTSTESPPRHSLTLKGAINVDMLRPIGSRIVATASGPVTATIRTHEFSDTVTLQSGFVEERTLDTNPTAATLRGTFQSGDLGGGVLVNTDSPLTTLSAGQYPSAGTLRITGNKGVMLMKPQSAGVTVELDYNDDGMVESTSTPTWDWML
jgi:hypothetical protein